MGDFVGFKVCVKRVAELPRGREEDTPFISTGDPVVGVRMSLTGLACMIRSIVRGCRTRYTEKKSYTCVYEYTISSNTWGYRRFEHAHFALVNRATLLESR